MTIAVTESAARRIKELIKEEARPDLRFRLSVSGGGCSGFQYGFGLDDQIQSDDHHFKQHGIEIVIDTVSFDLLEGIEVDYVEDLMGSSFRINNPHAVSTCGCGASFSL